MQIPGWKPPQLYGVVPSLGFVPPMGTGEVGQYGAVPDADATLPVEARGGGPSLAVDPRKEQAIQASKATSKKLQQQALLAKFIAAKTKLLVTKQLFEWAQEDVAFVVGKVVTLLAQASAINTAKAKKKYASDTFLARKDVQDDIQKIADAVARPFALPWQVQYAKEAIEWVGAAWRVPGWSEFVVGFLTEPKDIGALDAATYPSPDTATVKELEHVIKYIKDIVLIEVKGVAELVAAHATSKQISVAVVPADWDSVVGQNLKTLFQDKYDSPGAGARYTSIKPIGANNPKVLPGLGTSLMDMAQFDLLVEPNIGFEWVPKWLQAYVPNVAVATVISKQAFLDAVAKRDQERAATVRGALVNIRNLYAALVQVYDFPSNGKVLKIGEIADELYSVYGIDNQLTLHYSGNGSDVLQVLPSPVPQSSPLAGLVKIRAERYEAMESAQQAFVVVDPGLLSELMLAYAEIAAESNAAVELATYGAGQALPAKMKNVKELYDALDDLYFKAYGHHLPSFKQTGSSWDDVAKQILIGVNDPKPGSLAYAVLQAKSTVATAQAEYDAAVKQHGINSKQAESAAVKLEKAKEVLMMAKLNLANNFMTRSNLRQDLVDRRAPTYTRADDVVVLSDKILELNSKIVHGRDDAGNISAMQFWAAPTDISAAKNAKEKATEAITGLNTAGGAVVGTGEGMLEWARAEEIPLPTPTVENIQKNIGKASGLAETHTASKDDSSWIVWALAALAVAVQVKE